MTSDCPHDWTNDYRRPLLGPMEGLEGAPLACMICGVLWPGVELPEPDATSLAVAYREVTR
jgi:hypothetical protein